MVPLLRLGFLVQSLGGVEGPSRDGFRLPWCLIGSHCPQLTCGFCISWLSAGQLSCRVLRFGLGGRRSLFRFLLPCEATLGGGASVGVGTTLGGIPIHKRLGYSVGVGLPVLLHHIFECSLGSMRLLRLLGRSGRMVVRFGEARCRVFPLWC